MKKATIKIPKEKTLSPEGKPKKKRLLGIELMRGLAAFAVVFAHSGDKTWGEISRGVLILRSFFSFHVSFFLAISFYFLIRKFAYTDQGLAPQMNLKTRIQRLVVPYAIWSAIYLAFRTAFFLMEGNNKRLLKLYGDLTSSIFLGGASYHLYFLPMLMVGTLTFYVLNKTMKVWRKPWNMLSILGLLAAGVLANLIILLTNNQFNLGPNIAFQSFFNWLKIDPHVNIPLRLITVSLVWSSMCIPYIAIALLFNHLQICSTQIDGKNKISNSENLRNSYFFITISTAIFLVATFFMDFSDPYRFIQKPVIAFSLVGLALSLSYTFFANSSNLRSVVEHLGKCSFGIYLIHPIVIRLTRLGLEFIYPKLLNGVSIPSVIVISLISFLISWFLISRIACNNYASRYLM